jgi:hypothetical protein
MGALNLQVNDTGGELDPHGADGVRTPYSHYFCGI